MAMKELQLYIVLAIFTFLFVWITATEPLAVLAFFVAMASMMIIVGAVGFVCFHILHVWSNFQYRRRMEYLLGDMTLEEVLERSPYEYGYVFQGDAGYRIWRKDDIYDFNQSWYTRESAERWIVEQYSIDN